MIYKIFLLLVWWADLHKNAVTLVNFVNAEFIF